MHLHSLCYSKGYHIPHVDYTGGRPEQIVILISVDPICFLWYNSKATVAVKFFLMPPTRSHLPHSKFSYFNKINIIWFIKLLNSYQSNLYD